MGHGPFGPVPSMSPPCNEMCSCQKSSVLIQESKLDAIDDEFVGLIFYCRTCALIARIVVGF